MFPHSRVSSIQAAYQANAWPSQPMLSVLQRQNNRQDTFCFQTIPRFGTAMAVEPNSTEFDPQALWRDFETFWNNQKNGYISAYLKILNLSEEDAFYPDEERRSEFTIQNAFTQLIQDPFLTSLMGCDDTQILQMLNQVPQELLSDETSDISLPPVLGALYFVLSRLQAGYPFETIQPFINQIRPPLVECLGSETGNWKKSLKEAIKMHPKEPHED